MKIVHVTRRFVKAKWGGTETAVLESCKKLNALGHETNIVCPRALATADQEEIEGVDVQRTSYFYPYLGLSKDSLLQLDMRGGNLFSFALWKHLLKLDSLDLLHLHTGKRLGGIVRQVAKTRRIPYVVTLHGGVIDVPAEEKASLIAPTNGSFEWGKILGWWVGSRRVLDDAAAILCVGRSEQVAMQRKYPGKRVVYMPNGVEPKRFSVGNGTAFRQKHHIKPLAPVILNVGRIDSQKNQLAVVEALPAILRHAPELVAVFIGHITDPHYFEKIKNRAFELGVENSIRLIPGLDSASTELVDAYHAASIFVLPSQHEPFGIVILEAWAAGLPVIANRVGGIPGFVNEGEDAVLVDVKARGEFQREVVRLLIDRKRALELARRGQDRAWKEFSWTEIARQLNQVYETVRESFSRGSIPCR